MRTATIDDPGLETTLAPRAFDSSERYAAVLADDSAKIRAAQRLRRLVFGPVAGGEGEIDVDRFDAQMDHLLVVDREDSEVVGAYRLQTARAATAGVGFYSAEAFDLAPLEPLLPFAVELGRACVRPDRRDGVVLSLLWSGVADYMRRRGARYLFGRCSFPTVDEPAIAALERTFHREGRYVEGPRCRARAPIAAAPNGRRAFGAESADDSPPPTTPLAEAYFRVGARVASDAAVDRDFRCVDFLTLFDAELAPPRVARRYGFRRFSR